MAHRGKTQFVLVADDQLLFRSGLRTLLAAERDLEVVGEASTLVEVLAKQELVAPDVIVMSTTLLAGASESERGALRDAGEKCGLVLISDPGVDSTPELMAETGAFIAISRTTPAARIITTVRQAAMREEAAPGGMTQTAAGLEALAKAHGPKTSVLTLREQEVVRLLAEGRTVRETAAELSLSAKTIDAHKLNVMRKLDIHNRESLIQYAISQRIFNPVPA